MAATLDESIYTMWRNQASTHRQPHDPNKTTILIQGAKSHLTALASRMYSPAKQIEQALSLNAVSECFGRIYDTITKLESIVVTSSGYKTTPGLPLQLLSEMSCHIFVWLQGIELNTRHSVYVTNVNFIRKEKTATTTPLDLPISLPSPHYST